MKKTETTSESVGGGRVSCVDEKRIADRVARAVMSGVPDQVWDQSDPEAPKYGGHALVKLWKFVPGKIAAAEFDTGKLYILLSSAGLSVLSEEARDAVLPVSESSGDFRVFETRWAGAIWYEQPSWAHAFEAATGEQATKILGYDYEQSLQSQGKLPFDYASDAIRALRRHGWKTKTGKDGLAAVKQVRGTWIRVSEYGGRTLFVGANLSPRNLPYEQWKEYHEKTGREIYDVTTVKVEDIEKVAAEVADVANSMKPARQMKTYEDFEWRGEKGPEAYKKWIADLTETILVVLQSQVDYYEREKKSQWGRDDITRYLTTSYIIGDALNNRGMYPRRGLSNRDAEARVRPILDSLAKKHKIVRLSGDRGPVWEMPE